MDSSLLRQFGHLFRRSRAKFNQRLVIFGFFLIISTLIWYLSKLSHEYTTTVNYPIKFTNLPKERVLIGEPPSKITIRIKAFGYTLLRYKLSAIMVPLEIDITKSRLKSFRRSPTKFYIPTASIQNSFSSQLSNDLVLEGINPDTLFLEFANTTERKVPIRLDYSIEFEKQYMQSGEIKIKPDSITISGPKSIVDTISYISTKLLKFDKLNETQASTLYLKQIQQVKLSRRRVNVTIPVEKFTETSIKVPVDVLNVPDGYNIIVLPKTVEVRLNVALSHYFDLKPQLFKAVSTLYTDRQTTKNKLKVSLASVPEFVQIIDFDPKQVEYIIEKK